MSTETKIPEFIKIKIDQFTPFQRAYCEYRAQGMSQSISAKKAGSSAEDKPSLSRIGFQVEQIDGAKDYIDWIKQQRIAGSIVDGVMVIQMLRKVYDEALKDTKTLKDANTAAELIGRAIGLFGKTAGMGLLNQKAEAPKTDTTAFKEEDEDNETEDRIQRLQQLMKDMNLNSSNKNSSG